MPMTLWFCAYAVFAAGVFLSLKSDGNDWMFAVGLGLAWPLLAPLIAVAGVIDGIAMLRGGRP